jgi:hypothetical protein
MNYGFIVTRHVNSVKTNKYWNQCVRCIRRFYPFRKIVVIDDNSEQTFVKADFHYNNIEFIQSEYPGRGELLPFVYFLQRHFFDNAVIIHDSVFFHKRIRFEKIKAPVIPLWHFNPDRENQHNIFRIAANLKNKQQFLKTFDFMNVENGAPLNSLALVKSNKWNGFFGVQCFINYFFLANIESKYKITNLIPVVTCRIDRCALERIMAILFYAEFPYLTIRKSLLGNIATYSRWGYTFEEYWDLLTRKKQVEWPIVKVWTGR